MGEIFQQAKIHNVVDLSNVKSGYITEDQVRKLHVKFLVDTGATLLGLPIEMINQLGLDEVGPKEFLTGNGSVTRRIFNPVRLQVMDREADLSVMELMPDTPPIMGYLALEALDLCPNPSERRLEGNPAHGGKMLLKLL